MFWKYVLLLEQLEQMKRSIMNSHWMFRSAYEYTCSIPDSTTISLRIRNSVQKSLLLVKKKAKWNCVVLTIKSVSLDENRACRGWSGCNGIYPVFRHTYLAQKTEPYRCILFRRDRPGFFLQKFYLFFGHRTRYRYETLIRYLYSVLQALYSAMTSS